MASLTMGELPMCEEDWQCEDNVYCTNDLCVDQICQFVPNNDRCTDVHWCNGTEWCHSENDCQPGADPCGGLAYCMEDEECCCIFDHDCDGDVNDDDFDRFVECFGQIVFCKDDLMGLMRIPLRADAGDACCEANYFGGTDCHAYCEIFTDDFYGFAAAYEGVEDWQNNCDGPHGDPLWWNPYVECLSDQYVCAYGDDHLCIDGVCVECDDDGDCFSPTPYCSGEYECVQCRSNGHCSPPLGCCDKGDCVGCGQ